MAACCPCGQICVTVSDSGGAPSPNGTVAVLLEGTGTTGDSCTYTGKVTGISVVGGGSGYVSGSPPAVTVAAPPSGTTATATAVVSLAGVVTFITLVNPGTGYNTLHPAVTIAAPAVGTTATAQATVAATCCIAIARSGRYLITPTGPGGGGTIKTLSTTCSTNNTTATAT